MKKFSILSLVSVTLLVIILFLYIFAKNSCGGGCWGIYYDFLNPLGKYIPHDLNTACITLCIPTHHYLIYSLCYSFLLSLIALIGITLSKHLTRLITFLTVIVIILICTITIIRHSYLTSLTDTKSNTESVVPNVLINASVDVNGFKYKISSSQKIYYYENCTDTPEISIYEIVDGKNELSNPTVCTNVPTISELPVGSLIFNSVNIESGTYFIEFEYYLVNQNSELKEKSLVRSQIFTVQ